MGASRSLGLKGVGIGESEGNAAINSAADMSGTTSDEVQDSTDGRGQVELPMYVDSTNGAIVSRAPMANQNEARLNLPERTLEAAAPAQPLHEFVTEPPQERTLVLTVRSCNMYFEGQREEDEKMASPGATSNVPNAPSYVVPANTDPAQRTSVLNEADRDDLSHFISINVEVRDTLEDDMLDNSTSPPRADTPSVPSNTATEGTEEAAPRTAASDSQMTTLCGGDRDSSLDRLMNMLYKYPQNPMPDDSQGPLLRILFTTHDFSVSNKDANAFLKEDVFYDKVSFSMMAQNYDENIQEKGLHRFVRIMVRPRTARRYRLKMVNSLLVCICHRSSEAVAGIHDMVRRAVSSFCPGHGNFILRKLSPMVVLFEVDQVPPNMEAPRACHNRPYDE